MNIYLNLIQLIVSLVLFNGIFSSEIGVPVLLWQQKTGLPEIDSQLFDRKSTVNQIDGKFLAEDYFKNDETIVAFVQNHLSLEQLTAEDEQRLTSIKSIFRDQSVKPTLLTDVLNPTEALKQFSHQKWDKINVKNGDKVWIQLPEDTLAQNNQLIAQLMAEIKRNVSKDALFLITGRKNQFQSIDLEPEKRTDSHIRKARAADPALVTDEPKKDVKDDKRLIVFEDCLYFYTTFISVYNLSSETKQIDYFNTSVDPLSVDRTESLCFNNSLSKTPGLLKMTVINGNNSELNLSLVISNEQINGFWSLVDNSTVTVKSPKFPGFDSGLTFDLMSTQITAEDKFSYSCSDLRVYSKPTNNSKNEPIQIALRFRGFQLQPFKNPHNNEKNQRQIVFTDSFDCEVWMTLPLWMGLLTLLVLFIILSSGLYFIAIVNTPDRFENPKGKPLMINTVED